MVTVNLAEARDALSALIDRVEAGEKVLITRDGRPVAQILPPGRVERPLLPEGRLSLTDLLDDLAAFRATMPHLHRSSADLLRELRDEGP